MSDGTFWKDDAARVHHEQRARHVDITVSFFFLTQLMYSANCKDVTLIYIKGGEKFDGEKKAHNSALGFKQ